MSAQHRPVAWCTRMGVVPYPEALALQKRLELERQADRIPDVEDYMDE